MVGIQTIMSHVYYTIDYEAYTFSNTSYFLFQYFTIHISLSLSIYIHIYIYIYIYAFRYVMSTTCLYYTFPNTHFPLQRSNIHPITCGYTHQRHFDDDRHQSINVRLSPRHILPRFLKHPITAQRSSTPAGATIITITNNNIITIIINIIIIIIIIIMITYCY